MNCPFLYKNLRKLPPNMGRKKIQKKEKENNGF
jgi:hypothetical protein